MPETHMSYDYYKALFARCLRHGQTTKDIDEAMRWFSHANKLHSLFWNDAWRNYGQTGMLP